VVELKVIKMNSLWEKYALVCFLLMGFLHLVPTAEGAATHLFSRNLKTHELSYIGIAEPCEPGAFNYTNTVCAQQESFATLRNPSKDYKVIEYRDYESVLSQLPLDVKKFVMVNLTTYDWYLFDSSTEKKSPRNISATEYNNERLQLINVCSLEEFVSSRDTSDKTYLIFTMGITSFSIILTFGAAIFFYRLFWTTYLSSSSKCFFFKSFTFVIPSGLFSTTALINTILFEYVMDKGPMQQISMSLKSMPWKYFWLEFIIPLLSTLFNWSITISTIVIISSCKLKLYKRKYIWIFFVAIIPVLAIGIYSYLSDSLIVGRDNTSLQTAHYYINTLVGSSDDIQFHIKLM
jgi:hypothetical protein